MKKIALLLLILFTTSCSTSSNISYIVGRENFEKSQLKKEAPFEFGNFDNAIGFSNLPETLSHEPRTSKNWNIVMDKYKAECKYYIYQDTDKKHIIRQQTKWPENEEKPIKDPEGFFEYLRTKGITDYKVIKQDVWKFKNEEPIKVVLILYKGVKNEVKIKSTYITVTSYKLEDKEYWESKGNFMLDTSPEIFDKYQYKNQ